MTRVLIIILFVVFIFRGNEACNEHTHYADLYIYLKDGRKLHCDYVNIRGGEYGGCNNDWSEDFQYGLYMGDVKWESKLLIDSVVVFRRNIWTDGLPSDPGLFQTRYRKQPIAIPVIFHIYATN